MKVKEFINLYMESADKELPLLCIDSTGINNYYNSSDEFLQFGVEIDFKYLNGAVQLGLDGENCFVIIFCTCI